MLHFVCFPHCTDTEVISWTDTEDSCPMFRPSLAEVCHAAGANNAAIKVVKLFLEVAECHLRRCNVLHGS